MRVLIVGAGAVGGYFGGRLIEKGADVTFLVREKRKQQLAREGLVIKSSHGHIKTPVQTLVYPEAHPAFDLILLCVKAYHLKEVIHTIKPYVGAHTTILPLLNGISHYAILREAFGEERILGGLCFIEVTLNSKGEIEHYSNRHELVYGEWNHAETERIRQIDALFSGARFSPRRSDAIQVDIWKKVIFISTMSAMTCLMRSSTGPILTSPYGKEIYRRLLEEVVSIARYYEPSIPLDFPDATLRTLEEELKPTMKSSMLRDMEKGLPIETDALHGSLIQLAPKELDIPLLKTVYSTLSIYEEKRKSKTIENDTGV